MVRPLLPSKHPSSLGGGGELALGQQQQLRLCTDDVRVELVRVAVPGAAAVEVGQEQIMERPASVVVLGTHSLRNVCTGKDGITDRKP